MKKKLLISILFIISASASYSQLQKHDFRLSEGVYSSNFLYAVRDEVLVNPGDFYNISKNIDGATGALFFTYRNFPIPKLSVGASIGLERVKGDIMVDGMSNGRYSSDFFIGAIETDFLYVNKRHFQMYSGMGLGVAYHDEKNTLNMMEESDSGTGFIYQLNVIGMRVGGMFGFFVEAGYGYKGIAKFGIDIQL